jgi:hypothetical protein
MRENLPRVAKSFPVPYDDETANLCMHRLLVLDVRYRVIVFLSGVSRWLSKQNSKNLTSSQYREF